jgi:hypothetical protein
LTRITSLIFKAGFPAVLQQFGSGPERQRQFLLGFLQLLLRRVLLALPDDKPAAHRKERGRVEDLVLGIKDRESHAVGMPRQDGQRPQHHILHPIRQRNGAGELQDPGLGNRRQPLLHLLRQDQLRMEAFQPQQDGSHGAMTVAGRRERAVEVHPQRCHPVQGSGGLQFLGEDSGSPHRPYRVRARRPDPDGKEIKDTNSHGQFLTKRGSVVELAESFDSLNHRWLNL